MIIETKENNSSIIAFLKRSYLFLEDRDYKLADEYANKVLDINPECGEAYFIRFMCDFEIQFIDNKYSYNVDKFINIHTQNIIVRINQNSNYQKAVRFNFSKIKELEKEINDSIINRLIYISKNVQLNIDDLTNIYYFFNKNNIQSGDLENRLYQIACGTSNYIIFSKVFNILKNNRTYNKKIYISAYEHFKETNFSNDDYYSLIKNHQDFNEQVLLELYNNLEMDKYETVIESYKLMSKNQALDEKIFDKIIKCLENGEYDKFEKLRTSVNNKDFDENLFDKVCKRLDKNNIEKLYNYVESHKHYPKLSEKIYDISNEFLTNSEYSCFKKCFALIKNNPDIVEKASTEVCKYLERAEYQKVEALYSEIKDYKNVKIEFVSILLEIVPLLNRYYGDYYIKEKHIETYYDRGADDYVEREVMVTLINENNTSRKNEIVYLFNKLRKIETEINSKYKNIDTKKIIYSLATKAKTDIRAEVDLYGYLGNYRDSKAKRRKTIFKFNKMHIICPYIIIFLIFIFFVIFCFGVKSAGPFEDGLFFIRIGLGAGVLLIIGFFCLLMKTEDKYEFLNFNNI